MVASLVVDDVDEPSPDAVVTELGVGADVGVAGEVEVGSELEAVVPTAGAEVSVVGSPSSVLD